MLQCLETGLVYRNPHPHLRSIHAWHPTVVRLDSGELVAGFDLGEAVESFDYATYVSRSPDEGHTWSPPQRLMVEESPRPATHSLRLGRTADGTLTAFGGRFWRPDPDAGLVNRENLGYTPMHLMLLTSSDGGHTWEGPHRIEPPLVGPAFETCHRIVELSDGRWLAPTSTWKGWDGESQNGMKAVALVSYDRGQSWPEYLDVVDEYHRGIIHWELSLAELPDRRLLAVTWVVDEPSGRTLPSRYSIAGDGRTFEPPRLTGFLAQTAKVLVLRDGRILCLYRNDEQPGLWGELARIDGDRWVRLDAVPLWQGAGGAAGEGSLAEELSALRFGFPSMIELPGGDVLALFWCREDCVHNIRWLRIQVG